MFSENILEHFNLVVNRKCEKFFKQFFIHLWYIMIVEGINNIITLYMYTVILVLFASLVLNTG